MHIREVRISVGNRLERLLGMGDITVQLVTVQRAKLSEFLTEPYGNPLQLPRISPMLSGEAIAFFVWLAIMAVVILYLWIKPSAPPRVVGGVVVPP